MIIRLQVLLTVSMVYLHKTIQPYLNKTNDYIHSYNKFIYLLVYSDNLFVYLFFLHSSIN